MGTFPYLRTSVPLLSELYILIVFNSALYYQCHSALLKISLTTAIVNRNSPLNEVHLL